MSPIMLPIWGPFAIQWYGFFIALGALAFLLMIKRDPRFPVLNLQNCFDALFLWGAAAVLVGGRALHVMRHYDDYSSWTEWFAFWEPGYAVLGSTLAVLCVVPTYLYVYKVPLLPFLDLIATYAPLLQSIARFGCFFAGCCFGCAAHVPWATIYTDAASLAPTGLFLHPAQLYSAFGLFIVFIIMYFVARRVCTIPGQQTMLYLVLASTERFITDFWRGDREIVTSFSSVGFSLSFHQLLALGIITTAGILLLVISYRKRWCNR
jgi:phosphatidylglycerol---prolipoprotein diacylglyceryl transferase